MATAKKGRGRSDESRHLISIMAEIAETIQPCSVRALAYQLFNRKLISSMAKNETSRVSRLCVSAREEGTIPWEWIVDGTREERVVPTWADLVEYADTVMGGYRKNKWSLQPTFISVWSEKATIEGTIQPVLDEYEVPFLVQHGFGAATKLMEAARSNSRREQPTLLLYVGDYDPSGMSMSEKDLPKRLARYSSADPSDKDWDERQIADMLERAGLTIRRIALTKDHCRLLGPSTRFPASDKGPKDDKQGDSRYPWFVETFGEWCWELDALSPVLLRTSLEQAIKAELDHDAWNRCTAVEQLERLVIIDTCSTWGTIPGLDRQ